ncbi:hypothetical protein T492DRAFT_865743, partial [Pavlovales sp. CCMP2436]
VVPAGTTAIPHDDFALIEREVEKLERRRSVKRTAQHARLRDDLTALNSKIAQPRHKLSIS